MGSGTPTTAASATCGKLVQDVLDLPGADLLAARLDDVVLAPEEVQVSLFVHPEEVARVEHPLARAAAPGRSMRAVSSGSSQ